MAESFLIALREGFEAALVVAIVLAFVRRQAPEHTRAVWAGTVGALVVATVTGLILHMTIDGLEGVARLRTFAAICLVAAGLLTWMIFWMRKHSRALKGELEARASHALVTGSSFGLTMVAFAAVLREGLETALFLLSATSAADAGQVVAGTLLGLAAATVLGVLVYHGSSRVDMRRFFQITGALIILFAAGLMAKAVFFLQAAGDLSTVRDAVYDVTRYSWLTIDTEAGRFLAGIFGWDPRPSTEQVVVYFGYLLPVGYLYFRQPKAAAPEAVPPTPAPEPVTAGAH
jgi:high-affinity iron transporter